jgi:hypothetical protein
MHATCRWCGHEEQEHDRQYGCSECECERFEKEPTMEREIVWGVAVTAPLQKGAADKHCFGDCGKISMAGAIADELTGGLFVCCQPTCPYEAKVLENYGETMSFGRPHTVHLRLLEPVEAAA